MTAIPQAFADRIGVDLFAGQILSATLLFILLMVPASIAMRGKAGKMPMFFLSFLILGVNIAIGWLPTYFLLILSLLVAIMYAGKVRGWIS